MIDAGAGTKDFSHIPVLFKETIEGLNIKPDGIYSDGTMGGAGHSSAIAEALNENGRLYCFDQDKDAIKAGGERLSRFGEKVTLIHDNFVNMTATLRDRGVFTADGILLDLGVSSYQLDTAERGFTYKVDAPLDMRMDDRMIKTAADIVNTYSKEDLSRIFREYGEERFAGQIANKIVERRAEAPITTTFQLNDIILSAIPRKFTVKGGHPSKRTFQAIRIELNNELTVLTDALPGMIDFLSPGGRLCVITFHSLEDRIVKNAFKKAENPCICPPEFPVCTCGRESLGRVVTRRAILPSENEIGENRRAKSAKLRIFERERT